MKNTKQCTKCKENKDLSLFYKDSHGNQGRKGRRISCQKLYEKGRKSFQIIRSQNMRDISSVLCHISNKPSWDN